MVWVNYFIAEELYIPGVGEGVQTILLFSDHTQGGLNPGAVPITIPLTLQIAGERRESTTTALVDGNCKYELAPSDMKVTYINKIF